MQNNTSELEITPIVRRSDIVRLAKEYLNVPWRHQGYTRSGVDCVGLILAVGYELNMIERSLIVPPYKRQSTASLLTYFDKAMEPCLVKDIQDGTAVTFSYGGTPHHAGIVINAAQGAIIHAYGTERKVVIGYLHSNSNSRKFTRAYDFKGVQNG